MSFYVFFPSADAEQDAIWTYTAKTWGKDRADKYIRDLHDHLATLAKTRSLWRRLWFPVEVSWKHPVFLNRFSHHFIFFRELSNGSIGIISLLHERMDLPATLARDIGMMARLIDEK